MEERLHLPHWIISRTIKPVTAQERRRRLRGYLHFPRPCVPVETQGVEVVREWQAQDDFLPINLPLRPKGTQEGTLSIPSPRPDARGASLA